MKNKIALDRQQVYSLQKSFEQVLLIPETAAALFYERLFELEPSLRHMFKGDMDVQGRKLMSILKVAVASAGKLEQIAPAVSALGQRHAGYHVEEYQYDLVGGALLWTLEQCLGEGFDPLTRQAWVDVYSILANIMKDGMKEGAKTITLEKVVA